MPPHTILRPKPPDAANKRELHTCLHNYRYICCGTIMHVTIMQQYYNAAKQVFCPISLRRCIFENFLWTTATFLPPNTTQRLSK